jgi:hypothetical protein
VNGVRCSMNWHELQVTVREPGSDMPARPI